MSDCKTLAYRISSLSPDEQQILKTLLTRLERGRVTYGAWNVSSDPRNFNTEALEEVYDALHYVAAELIKLSKLKQSPQSATGNSRIVFVCCQFSNKYYATNLIRLHAICEGLHAQDLVPVVPMIGINEKGDSEANSGQLRESRNQLINLCTELHVFGGKTTPQMEQDLEFADAIGLPIMFVDEASA